MDDDAAVSRENGTGSVTVTDGFNFRHHHRSGEASYDDGLVSYDRIGNLELRWSGVESIGWLVA